MKDLSNPKAIWMKGILFLFTGVASAALILIEMPTIRTGFLLVLAIWAFCRSYYFAFYVLEKYVDPEFRFAGLGSLLRYILKHRTKETARPDETKPNED